MLSTKEEYQAAQGAQQKIIEQAMKVTQSVPIPTQEELNLMRLGLMHVDEKVDPNNPEMPSVAVQQAYFQAAMKNPDQPPPEIQPLPPEPPVVTHHTVARRPEPPKPAA